MAEVARRSLVAVIDGREHAPAEREGPFVLVIEADAIKIALATEATVARMWLTVESSGTSCESDTSQG